MATPKETVWERDGHTGAKHDLLRRYLQAWVPILLGTNPRVTYAEGFAGPGVYLNGEPGSPVIALETFCAYPDKLAMPRREAHLIFVEERQDRVSRLEEEIQATTQRLGPLPANLICHPVVKGDCSTVLTDALRESGAAGSPMFVILDSFGGPDIPFELLQFVARNRSSEVLLTFQPAFLTRHGERSAHQASGNAAFGGDHWQGVFDRESLDKLGFLVQAYRETLVRAGFRYSLAFEMKDEGGRELWLLFGTSNLLGVEKMKDAMWSVDPIHGVQYRDPRDPDQMFLAIELVPDSAPLERMLLERLRDRPQSLEELRAWTNTETVYKKGQVLKAVRSLVAHGRIEKPTGHLAGDTKLTVATCEPSDHEQGALF
jgi:three-Cys-motif partner protein